MESTVNNIISLNNVNFTNVETHEYMINVLNGFRNKILLI